MIPILIEYTPYISAVVLGLVAGTMTHARASEKHEALIVPLIVVFTLTTLCVPALDVWQWYNEGSIWQGLLRAGDAWETDILLRSARVLALPVPILLLCYSAMIWAARRAQGPKPGDME